MIHGDLRQVRSKTWEDQLRNHEETMELTGAGRPVEPPSHAHLITPQQHRRRQDSQTQQDRANSPKSFWWRSSSAKSLKAWLHADV